MLNTYIWQQKAVYPSFMCWFHCIISLSNAFLALDVTNLSGLQKHDCYLKLMLMWKVLVLFNILNISNSFQKA